mmetsp:Transcript_3011/g.4673  ORF Transcript_3011/g.4673 Transcript_3011/m.4673 type:complete len:243 (+) Transcript_3011:1653-2381(+)
MHALGSLHSLVHTCNARMRDLFHDFNLRVHALPVRRVLQFGLVVRLDGHFRAGQAMPSSTHFAVAAHAHHFPHHVHVHHRRAGGHNATPGSLGQRQQLLQLNGVAFGAELVGHSGETHVQVVFGEGVQRRVAYVHGAHAVVSRAVLTAAPELGRGGRSGHGDLWVRATHVHWFPIHLLFFLLVAGRHPSSCGCSSSSSRGGGSGSHSTYRNNCSIGIQTTHIVIHLCSSISTTTTTRSTTSL